jgi:cytochrome P450
MPGAVEELLRFVPLAPTAAALPRYATRDVEVGAVTVRAGQPVLTAQAAANRDPRAFRDPDRFDVTREPRPHLAFGYGTHHCVGAELARMELRVALAALLAGFPDLRLAVPADALVWRSGLAVRGPLTLPVTW